MRLKSSKISFCTSHFTCDLWDILSHQGKSVLHHLFLNFIWLYFPSGCLFPPPLLNCPMSSSQATQSQCIIAFPSGKCAIFDQRSTHAGYLYFHSLLFFWKILRKVYWKEIFLFCVSMVWMPSTQVLFHVWYGTFKVWLQIFFASC